MKLIRLLLLFSITISIFTACQNDDDIEPSEPVVPEIKIPQELAIDSIQVFNEMKSGYAEAHRLGLRFPFSDFEPTGVYVKPYSILKVDLKLLEGSAKPKLLIGTYSRGNEWNRQPKSIDLNTGQNTINTGTKGGMVYVRYITDNTPASKAEIKFADGWEHSPLYKKDHTTNTNWKQMLSYHSEAPTATLVGDKTFLVVSRSKAIEHQNENQYNLLESIDQVIAIQNDLSGMDGSSDLHEPMSHKLLLAEYEGTEYYMFAYEYRTAYRKSDGVDYILSLPLFNQNGWGPWHEIGHMHQMNAWTWGTVVESTVNLYSLIAEKSKGNSPSRLKRDGVWEKVSAYLQLEETDKDFNGSETDVWMRLAMFYQLQLAYGDDFYKELHKTIREENPTINSDNDRMRVFMLTACNVSNTDLSSFFKTWGLKFDNSEAVFNEIVALSLNAPDSDISSLSE